MDPLAQFKEGQKQGWAHFAPLEALTTPAAGRLVRLAGVQSGQRVLDAACGTGVVAITSARRGAQVTGLDLTPELIERARENARIANVAVEWHEGDVEQLPFPDATFDVVVSQFGHIFAPRPEVAIAQMLRVLRPGGTIAFATWPPEHSVGKSMLLASRYMPPPPPGVSPPWQWGDPNVVRDRLGDAVDHLVFARATMLVPALSPQHARVMVERTSGPIKRLVEALATTEPARLESFRREFEGVVETYLEDNVIRQDYLLTRAIKK